MAVCQFYLKGTCRFGASCRNEHPAQSGTGNRQWSMRTGTTTNGMPPSALFNVDSMTKDVMPGVDKPLWPLSSYGPAKLQPVLIANVDESPEELRVRAMVASKSGSLNDYLKYESEKILASDQAFNNVRSQIEQAYHQAALNSSSPGAASAFVPTQSNTNPAFAFGGAAASGFGSAFGANSTQIPPFGGGRPQPSTFGQSSAFGAPANPPATSPFGSPEAKSAFPGVENTSSFGKLSFGQSAFGQPSFGQAQSATSAFEHPAASASAFGAPQTTSAFGQPSQPSSFIKPPSGAFAGSGGAFAGGASGKSAFGSAGAAPSGFSVFSGQPSAFGLGATNATAPAFGRTSLGSTPPTTAAFGAPAQGGPATSAFAPSGPSAFGTQAQQGAVFGANSSGTGSAFGLPSSASLFAAPDTSASAFGAQPPLQTQSAFAPAQNQGPSVFGTGTSSAFGPAAVPPTSAFATATTMGPTSAFNTLTSTQPKSAFNTNPSTSAFSAPAASSPFGASAFASNASLPPKPSNRPSLGGTAFDQYDKLLPPDEEYMKMLPESVRKAFEADAFEWGNVPDWIPPKAVR